jgi:hypothetical protein
VYDDFAIVLAMEPRERDVAVRLPSGRRRDRRADLIELVTA